MFTPHEAPRAHPLRWNEGRHKMPPGGVALHEVVSSRTQRPNQCRAPTAPRGLQSACRRLRTEGMLWSKTNITDRRN